MGDNSGSEASPQAPAGLGRSGYDPGRGATAEMLKLDVEGRRLEARDRALAMSIGSRMAERFFDPECIEDMRDVRRQILEAAEFAAYEAIQKEREFHAGDMAMLRKWADAKLAEQMLNPAPPLAASRSK